MRTTNAVAAWNFFLRLQPERGFLRPYLDIFVGIHVLTTNTEIGEGDTDDDIDGDFDVNNSSDTVFAFGAGAGIQFPSSASFNQDGRRVFSIDLDLGARVLRRAAGLITWSKAEGRGSSIRGHRAPIS